MAMALCASCKQRVEDGSIRCPSCGSSLDLPGAFTQVLGWVVIAVSTIPFAISEVTTAERDLIPLFIAIAILAFGVVLVVMGRVRSKGADPKVLSDPEAQSHLNP